MKIRNVLAMSIVILSLAASSKVYAAPASFAVPVHAIFAKVKLVRVTVRNDSKAPIEMKAGEQVMTLAVGKTLELKLAVGTSILANAPSGNYQTGDVLAQVTTELSDTTLVLR